MSKIEWTDKTQNPITVAGGGHYCIKVSPGCKNCYAEKMNGRRLTGGDGLKYRVMPESPDMALNREMMKSWARARKHKKIFVGSMTDVFGEWVPDQFVFGMLSAMANAPKITFQVLTKRPGRMSRLVNEWSASREIPGNIWLGTSAENQEFYDKRIGWLCQIDAVRFLSLEPLLGQIDLGPAVDTVNWVIVGGESGLNARPLNIEWIEDIIEQCRKANAPVFVKQLGSVWARENKASDTKGGDPEEWPEYLRYRMFPKEL